MYNVNWLYAKVMSAHRDDVARRVTMLYGYETQGRRRSELVLHPRYQVAPALFAEWLNKKRFITPQMLMAHRKWFKEGDHGHSFVISFLADGTLVECAAGNQDAKWKGTWTLQALPFWLLIVGFFRKIFVKIKIIYFINS
jgi:hypothetical protein